MLPVQGNAVFPLDPGIGIRTGENEGGARRGNNLRYRPIDTRHSAYRTIPTRP